MDAAITQSLPNIFNFQFPFYTDIVGASVAFQKQFVWHYLDQEIGMETIGAWKMHLKSKLTDIMPFYAKIYQLEQEKYNPFDTTKMSKSYNATNNANSTTSSDTSDNTASKSKDSFSDTPQGAIDNVIAGTYLSEFRYLDSDAKTSGHTASTAQSDGTTNTTEEWHGKEGGYTYAEIKTKEKEAFNNINKMIIEECRNLFMGVF